MNNFRIVVMLMMCYLPVQVWAQRDTIPIDLKKEIVINNKRFRVYNNWISGGAGPAYHSANPRTQLAVGVNYNFHIKQYYFRLGGQISGDDFGLWNNYQLHGGWIPYRKETENFNLALMGGLSYSTGYEFLYAGVYETTPYNEVGGIIEIQYIRKWKYDVGFGPAFFAEINGRQSIVGVRLDMYFSGAYRGESKGKRR
jgi:hypothetical protein